MTWLSDKVNVFPETTLWEDTVLVCISYMSYTPQYTIKFVNSRCSEGMRDEFEN